MHNFYLIEFNIKSIVVKTKNHLIKTKKQKSNYLYKFARLRAFDPHSDLARWPRIKPKFAGLYLQTRVFGSKVPQIFAEDNQEVSFHLFIRDHWSRAVWVKLNVIVTQSKIKVGEDGCTG